MKKQLLSAALFFILFLSGCQLIPSDTAITGSSSPSTPSSQTYVSPLTTPPLLTQPVTVTSAPDPGPSQPVTSAVGSRPSRGILSEMAEYGPGNPRSHALAPVERDLKRLTDKTRKENERYRSVFQKYLGEIYPEYEFRITDIMDIQLQGQTYKTSRAYAAQSLDVSMDLYFDGLQVTDTFERDVIGRRNTMNRWRAEFRQILEPLLKNAQAGSLISPDVSFDYYRENIPLIRLDQPLDPKGDDFVRCLELYVQRGMSDPVKVSEAAHAAYKAIRLEGYAFQEYYIYLEDERGTRSSWQVPMRLIASASFPLELQKAMAADHPQNLIQRVERPAP